MGNETVRQSKESITLMTSYRFPHHNSGSFTFASGWRLTFLSLWRLAVCRHSERRQECCVGNLVNETVARSEESITPMTTYRFPHHNSGSFTFTSGWRLSLASFWAGSRMGLTRIKRVMFYHSKLHTAKSAFAHRLAAADGSAFLMKLFLCHSKSVCPFFRHTPLRFHVT